MVTTSSLFAGSLRARKASKYCLDDVLRREGKGVVKPNEAKKCMDVWFSATMSMINVHIHKIIIEDSLVELKKETVPLTSLEIGEGRIMKARKDAGRKCGILVGWIRLTLMKSH